MSFFKDLKEDIGTMGDFGSDDNQMVDILSEAGSDNFDEFDLSEEDSLGVDESMIEKMENEDSLNFAGEEAAEVYLHTNRLDGGITSKGCVKIAGGTVVIGDITVASCVAAGAVKGNLDVNGPVVVDSTAVIKGNISSKGIRINSGAVIDGFCALPYAAVDIDSFFGDEVEA